MDKAILNFDLCDSIVDDIVYRYDFYVIYFIYFLYYYFFNIFIFSVIGFGFALSFSLLFSLDMLIIDLILF